MKKWCWLLLLLTFSANAERFSFTDTHGNRLRLSDYKGKWVLVNFWATWCPPCQAEIPELNQLYRAHRGRDLTVIGVAMDYDSPKTVLDFVKAKKMDYPIVLGNPKLALQVGQIQGLPSSFLYDPDGNLVAGHTGAVTRDDVEGYIGGN